MIAVGDMLDGETVTGLPPACRLFGALRMVSSSFDDPHDVCIAVRAVPNPAPRGDFVLPLVQRLALDLVACELPSKSMLSAGILG